MRGFLWISIPKSRVSQLMVLNSSRCCATLSVLVFKGVNEILWYFLHNSEKGTYWDTLQFGLVLWFASQQRSFLTSVPNFDRPCLNSYLKSVKLLVVAGALRTRWEKLPRNIIDNTFTALCVWSLKRAAAACFALHPAPGSATPHANQSCNCPVLRSQGYPWLHSTQP